MERAEGIVDEAISVPQPRLWAWFREHALPLMVAAFLIETALFAIAGRINQDEGWYLVAAHKVYQGETLYADFPYFQGPLLPYIYGPGQVLFDGSLYAGRATAVIFACVTLVAVIMTAKLLDGRTAAAWAVGLLLFTPNFVLSMTTARSEAPVVALVALAAFCALRWPEGLRGLLLPTLFLLLACGIRLTYVPLFGAMCLYVLWRARPSTSQMIVAGGALAAVALLMYGPFFAIDGEAAYFNIWTSQSDRGNQLGEMQIDFGDRAVIRVFYISVAWLVFMVVMLPAAAIMSYILGRFTDGWRPGLPGRDADPLSNYTLLLAMAMLAWAPSWLLERQEPRYFVAAYPLAAVVVGAAATRAAAGGFGEAGRYVLLPIVPVAALFGFSYSATQGAVLLNLRNPDVMEANAAGDFIRPMLRDDGSGLFTTDHTISIAAGAKVPNELAMGYFSYWPSLADSDLDRYHLVNRERARETMFAPETRVIAVSDFDLGAFTASASAQDLDFSATDEPPFMVFPELRAHYDIVRTYTGFGQVEDRLFILKRK